MIDINGLASYAVMQTNLHNVDANYGSLEDFMLNIVAGERQVISSQLAEGNPKMKALADMMQISITAENILHQFEKEHSALYDLVSDVSLQEDPYFLALLIAISGAMSSKYTPEDKAKLISFIDAKSEVVDFNNGLLGVDSINLFVSGLWLLDYRGFRNIMAGTSV